MSQLTVQHDSPDFRILQWGSLLVAVWARTPNVSDLTIMAPYERLAIARSSCKICVLTVLQNLVLTQPPSDDLRHAAASLTREFAANVLGTATVIDAPGLVGSIARSFITGVNLLARSITPTKVFKSVEEAMGWFISLPEQSPTMVADAPEIVAALEQQLR